MTSAMGTALITGHLPAWAQSTPTGLRDEDMTSSASPGILEERSGCYRRRDGSGHNPVRADLGNPEDLRRVESILRMESYRQSNIPHLQYMHQRAVGSDREDAYV